MGSLYDVRKPPHQRTMGIELECIIDDKAWNVCKSGGFWQFWYFTTDGSIDVPWGHRLYGAELISQPLPYEALIKQIKRLHKKIGDWQHNESCGIHVHVSRKMFCSYRRREWLDFLCTLTSDQTKSLFGRASNTYCDPWSDNKYCAINSQHDATYEFRMFSSGNADWAIECVKRTYRMTLYRGPLNYDAVCNLFQVEPVRPAAAPLVQEFRQAAQVPMVRRVRRA